MGIGSNALALGGTWLDGEDVFLSKVLSHELGHCFGLYHTHHGTCIESDTNDIQCAELAYDPANPNANGDICGDYVPDTWGSAKIRGCYYDGFEGYPPGFPCEQWEFVYENSVDESNGCQGDYGLDVLGNPYNLSLEQATNIMSTTTVKCLGSFTEGQGERMRTFLNTHPALIPATKPMDYIEIGGTLNVGLTTIGFTNRFLTSDLIVPNGATLEINESKILVKGSEDIKIVVAPGGKLIINNSSIKPYCQKIWQGIELESTTYYLPTTEEFENGTNKHGELQLSGSTIENAVVGVKMASNFLSDGGCGMYSGILKAYDTEFINCHKGIYVGPTVWANLPINYAAASNVVHNCTFTFNKAFGNNFNYAFNSNYVGIMVERANFAIDVTASTFEVTDEQLPIWYGTYRDLEQWPIGILLKQANMNIGTKEGLVDGTPVITGNKFKNLFKGVDAYSIPSVMSAVNVWHNDFIGTTKGITFNSVALGEIENNVFDIPKTGFIVFKPDSNDDEDYNGDIQDAYGVYLIDAQGVSIKLNSFKGNDDYSTLEPLDFWFGYEEKIPDVEDFPDVPFYAAYGLFLKGNKGETGMIEVFENHFEDLGMGTVFQDNNYGVRLQCNAYEATFYDWFFSINPETNEKASLGQQGVCDPLDNSGEFLFNNSWHTPLPVAGPSAQNIDRHIKLQWGEDGSDDFELTLVSDQDSNPPYPGFLIPGVVNVEFCPVNQSVETNPICDICLPLIEAENHNGYPVYVQCEETDIVRDVRSSIGGKQMGAAISRLEATPKKWADKLLVGSYLDRGRLVDAQNKLNTITVDNTEDQTFADLMQVLIDGEESGTFEGCGSEKQAAVKATLENINKGKRASPKIESALAIYFNQLQTRNMGRYKNRPSLTTNINELESLYLYPNPISNGEILVLDLAFETEEIIIYDAMGRVQPYQLIEHHTINTKGMNKGLYLITAYGINGEKATGKLMVK